VVNEDIERPLLTGTMGASDPPTRRTFPLIVQTAKTADLPDKLPAISHPIPPGGSDQFQISLRFGPPGATMTSLARDIYQQFAQKYPMRFGWTDRRPIGTLFLSSAAAGFRTNPRGWFLDPSIDINGDPA